jgi:hypothetical protein
MDKKQRQLQTLFNIIDPGKCFTFKWQLNLYNLLIVYFITLPITIFVFLKRLWF